MAQQVQPQGTNSQGHSSGSNKIFSQHQSVASGSSNHTNSNANNGNSKIAAAPLSGNEASHNKGAPVYLNEEEKGEEGGRRQHRRRLAN